LKECIDKHAGRMRCAVSTLALAATFCVSSVRAGEMDAARARESAGPLFELTPFVGYRMGGNFAVQGATRNADLGDHGSFALALGLRIDEGSQYELFYSRQRTRFGSDSPAGPVGVTVEYLHVGGTLVLDDEQPRFQPYAVGGLGISRFNPEPGGANDNTRFSLSLGAGMRFPVTQRFGVRLEARGFVTLVNADSAVFCASGRNGGICAIRASGSSFFQYELLAGAAFAF
jgi:opacity protein-like surface antigen